VCASAGVGSALAREGSSGARVSANDKSGRSRALLPGADPTARGTSEGTENVKGDFGIHKERRG